MSEVAVAGGRASHDPTPASVVAATTDDGHTHETTCLNCATSLVGPHCHACGQMAHVHRTLGAFFHDLLHGVFHFEGRIWRTLPMLALRPGRLTRDYIAGRRASYLSPTAIFLFAVFLMFAAAGLTGPVRLADRSAQDLANSARNAETQLIQLRAERTRAGAAGAPTAALDARIRGQEQALRVLRDVSTPRAPSGSDILRLDNDAPAWLAAPLRHAAANPELFFYKLKSSAYKFSWALIPLSVPFVWLLFPFSRRFGLYDHTVFVTYSLTFMSLLVSLGMVAMALNAGALTSALAVLAPAHLFVQLRGAYGLSFGGALWRTVLLGGFAMLALLAYLAGLVTMGVFE